jgi:regulator of replication initiation timing
MLAATEAERLRKLEAENAGLRAELSELRRRLKRYEAMESVLAETGRLAR